MYTQNYNKNPVITFQNKDCIRQMRALEAKNKAEKSENKNENVPNKTNISLDNLLILGILLGIADTESIKCNYFQLIAGLLLAL